MLFCLIGCVWLQNLPVVDGDGQVDLLLAAFVISFKVVVGWVLLQIGVAVLLDNFMDTSRRIETDEARNQHQIGRLHEQVGSLESRLRPGMVIPVSRFQNRKSPVPVLTSACGQCLHLCLVCRVDARMSH